MNFSTLNTTVVGIAFAATMLGASLGSARADWASQDRWENQQIQQRQERQFYDNYSRQQRQDSWDRYQNQVDQLGQSGTRCYFNCY